MAMDDCECMQPRQLACESQGEFIGVDMSNSRYGDVWRYQCPQCQQQWLFYRVEYPSFSQSGRWFRALLDASLALDSITPADAETLLNRASYRIVGGSYYQSAGIVIRGETTLPFD
ncbi:hypothetical protein JYB87_15565 [Shewanella avicenniae]|uniref:Uncharacterized protein n=1 Tax=Shewanella avicenniae TaxID=2814294 RepID=A0ABX7QR08_9GAMM|nr:hypothetical protein [Shewanella avicenniae]QSX33126.1 hypothetical protein JYB87_15565 [Shewanella avicenniae]